MKKLLIAFLFACSPAFATDFQDIWWDASKAGMGIIVGQQGTSMFVTWFTYDSSSAGVWYLFTGTLQAASAVNGVLQQPISGQLQQYNGTPPPQYNPAASTAKVVGTGTLTFTSPVAATFNYTLNGVPGSMSLQRYNFASIVPDGQYTGTAISTASGCTVSGDNATGSAPSTLAVTTNGTAFNMLQAYSNVSCTYNGQYTQGGSKYMVNGNFNCTNGSGGTWATTDLSLHDIYLIGTIVLQYTSGETCFVTSEMAFVSSTRQPASLSSARR